MNAGYNYCVPLLLAALPGGYWVLWCVLRMCIYVRPCTVHTYLPGIVCASICMCSWGLVERQFTNRGLVCGYVLLDGTRCVLWRGVER